MICPACGNEFSDEMPICPYCQTPVTENPTDTWEDYDYDSIYSVDAKQLRKNHQLVFLIGLLLVLALSALAFFFQLQKPSLATQIRRADATELATICMEYPEETADDAYTQTLLNAIAELQQTYAMHNDQESQVLESLQQIAATKNVIVRERACDAVSEMESERLLQEINRVRTQRQKRMLTEENTLKETALLLADTYQEAPDTYEAEAPRIVQDSMSTDAADVYHVMLMHCNTYSDAIAQYNEEKKEISVNFLTTQDYTRIGISSIYDPTTKQFAFIILLLP